MNRTAGDETVFATSREVLEPTTTTRHVHFQDEEGDWENEEEDMSIASIQVEEFSDQDIPVRAAERVLLPPATLAFIRVQIQSEFGDHWLVDRTTSACPQAQWVIPNCLVNTSEDGTYVPMINLSPNPLWCFPGDLLATMEPLSQEVANNASVSGCFTSNNQSTETLPEGLVIGSQLDE